MPKLPPYRQDPAVIGAQSTRDAYAARIKKIAAEPDRTNAAKTRDIESVTDEANRQIDNDHADLQSRRVARHDVLAKTLPFGPLVPPDASAADAAVLHQLHRAATATVSDMTVAQRTAALATAMRDGDVTMTRAITSVALTEGDQATIAAITATQADDVLASTLAEMDDLKGKVAGSDFLDANLRAQTFAHVGDRAAQQRRMQTAPVGSGMGYPSRTVGTSTIGEKIARSGIVQAFNAQQAIAQPASEDAAAE